MVIHVISSPDLPFFLTRWPLGDRNVILKMQFSILIYIGIFKSSYDNVLRWMPQNLTGDKSTLVQVMAWCHQATSHYLNQCWPRSLTPYGVTRPQWFKWCHMSIMASQITNNSAVCQQLVQTGNKEIIHVLSSGPLWGESTKHWWIPHTKGQQCGRCFHFMTS